MASVICIRCGKHWAFLGHVSRKCIYCLGIADIPCKVHRHQLENATQTKVG